MTYNQTIMKTKSNTPFKALMLIMLMPLFLFTSCIYHEEVYPRDGRDGSAYVRLNWYDNEPDYVDPGSIVPFDFYWNRYYCTSPGYYTVYYEYTYHDGYHLDTYAYEADVEVWVNRGEAHYRYDDGRDGSDTYFDLDLYADGSFDYNVYEKSAKIDTTVTLGIFKTVSKQVGERTCTVTYKKVAPRPKN